MGKDPETRRLAVVTRQTSVWIVAAVNTAIILALVFVGTLPLLIGGAVPWDQYWAETIEWFCGPAYAVALLVYLSLVAGTWLYRRVRS